MSRGLQLPAASESEHKTRARGRAESTLSAPPFLSTPTFNSRKKTHPRVHSRDTIEQCTSAEILRESVGGWAAKYSLGNSFDIDLSEVPMT